MPALSRIPLEAVEDAGGGCLRLVCAPASIVAPVPGQFYMVRGQWEADPLLPRPFSVARFRTVKDEQVQLEFLLRIIGRGTRLLGTAHEGIELDILGPLGVGFEQPPGDSAWMVAGGIGIAPFPALMDAIATPTRTLSLLVGARTEAEIPGLKDFEANLTGGVEIATDDGSAGFAGTVVDLLASRLDRASDQTPSQVYVCGPHAMMEAAAAVCMDAGVPCSVSLEAPMGCGMGTCRGCVIRTFRNTNFTICTDGPVTDANVIWSEQNSQ